MHFIAWLVFLTGLFIAFDVVDFLGYCSGDPVVERLTVSGLALELAGLFFVFLGIGDRLKLWGETTLGSGSVGTLTPGDRTLQQQIDDLRAYIVNKQKEIAHQFKRIENRLENQIAESHKRMQHIEQSLTELVKTLEAKVKESDIGNVHMEIVGVFWIGTGIVVATLPGWVEEQIRAPLQFDWVQSIYSFLCG